MRQRRPALVIAVGPLLVSHGLLWLATITSAANSGWRSDVPIFDLVTAGLPIPSIIRPAKIATIEARDALTLGTLAPTDRVRVSRTLQDFLSTALC